MSNKSKQKSRTERAERVAQMRRDQARLERRRRLVVAGTVVAAIVVVVVALVAVGLSTQGAQDGKGSASTAAASAVQRGVSSVPAAVLDRVGKGSVTTGPSKISAPALTAGGRPRVLYVGAEYCPYCAAQRWPVAVALARFGTWSHLGQTHSASQDVFPNTPTLSFHGASYRSDYLSFTGVETTSNKPSGNGYEPLDTLSAEDQALVDTYNRPPYVAGQGGAIPFVDLGGRYVSSGASYDPGLLAGMSQADVAKALGNPSEKVAQAVDGAANAYTAALCDLTGQKPATVCTSAGVQAASSLVGP